MLLRPLFFTSFLIDDQLADEGLTERGPIVISSASSKTAIAAAFLLAQRQGVELVGLTSPRQRRVRRRPGDLRPHRHLRGDRLARARPGHLRRLRRRRRRAPGRPLPLRRRAGPQHGGRGDPLGGLRRRWPATCPGPTPTFFFAPTRVTKRAEDWGRAGLEQRVAEAWHPFCEWTGGWLETHPRRGLRGGARRLPRRARGPGRAAQRPRDLALRGPSRSPC